jgi:nucleotide-binding universal stress UspA family protein
VTYHRAILDFRRARRQAERELRRARLTGKQAELLPFDDVRRLLGGKTRRDLGLRDIPLDAIVGSVGRYSDFTRSFLPLQDEGEERWARIQVKTQEMVGLPPVEVYKIGKAYFVRDGNHRVSVARQLGATHIEAFVTEIETKVPLSPEDNPDDLILKGEQADFLELTQLDETRSEAGLSVTVSGQYAVLLEQIEAYRRVTGLEQGREPSIAEAAAQWYDESYLPMVQLIREQGILEDFPDRTEADLYLWISEHRRALEEMLEWEVGAGEAAVDLAEQFSPKPEKRIARLTSALLDTLTPDPLEGGPAAGTWRRERLALHRHDCMFADILVAVSGKETDWPAVAQAVEIACRESARLLGLHVVNSASDKESDRVRALQAEFARHCEVLGVAGKLAIEVGQVARKLCERARWADLAVVSLAHPPARQPVIRLGSGFRTLVRRCATPVLAVPGMFSPLSQPLLAYDGSPKAREALYVAAYVAGRSGTPLTVLSVSEGDQSAATRLDEAAAYLEPHGVQAHFVESAGPVAQRILETARAGGNDLILMGGYGYSPVLELVLGSAVDEVLRHAPCPVLICR